MVDEACASAAMLVGEGGDIDKMEDDVDDDLRLVISDEKTSNSPCSSANEEHEHKMLEGNQKTPDASHTQPTSQRSSPKKVGAAKEQFSWSDYLRDTGAVAAPPECFFQDPTIPRNKFTVGKKIELPDPRGKDVQCLATIVAVHSVWICARLDGEDATNDQWMICDDDRIKPVGDAEQKGIGLQPPYGFMHNLAHYHRFIENQLKPDEDGEQQTASLDCFVPISYKHHPDSNMFKMGMKCEAIDYKNFNGRPCPATVVASEGDFITVAYDGWNQAYDTKQRYDGRHVFPIGWSARAGVEVQPPKTIKGKVKQPILHIDVPEPPVKETPKQSKSTASHKSESTKRKSTSTPSGGPSARKARVSGKGTPSTGTAAAGGHKGGAAASRSPIVESRVAIVNPLADGATSKPKEGSKRNSPKTASSVESSHVTPGFKGGTKVKKEPASSDNGASESNESTTKPRAKKTIGSSAPVADSTPSGTKKTGKSWAKAGSSDGSSSHCSPSSLAAPDIILTTEGHSKMTVYLNRGCRCEPMLDSVKVRGLPAQIGPGRVHHVMREVIQHIVNCAAKPSAVFSRLDPGSPRIISITAEINNKTYVRAIPTVKSLPTAWAYLRAFINKLDVCPSLISQTPSPCSVCSPRDDGVFDSVLAGASKPFYGERISDSGESEDSEERSAQASESALSSWSVTRVAEAIEASFGPAVAAKFTQNQMDGKALMLLTTELLIRHLDMPFGPALKMMSFVDALKRKYRRGTPNAAS